MTAQRRPEVELFHHCVGEGRMERHGGVEAILGEHLRTQRPVRLDPQHPRTGRDLLLADRVENPSAPTHHVGQGPRQGREVLQRWDPEQAHLSPWRRRQNRIEQHTHIAPEAGRRVTVLRVVDPDRDEDQVGVGQHGRIHQPEGHVGRCP